MEGNGSLKTGNAVSFRWLATESLDPKRTDDLFVEYESLFVEVCTRWISLDVNPELEIAAYGRILPLAPHLAEHAERLATFSHLLFLGTAQASVPYRRDVSSVPAHELCQSLLGIFRLLSFDCRNFAKYVRASAIQELLCHPNPCVRYLAVRTFCLYAHAADNTTRRMIKQCIGDGEVEGEWEGKIIDYRFLSLWEEKRWKELQMRLKLRGQRELQQQIPIFNEELSPYTANISGVLLPRLDGAPSLGTNFEIISTPTTESNLKNIANALLRPNPLLLIGLAGSGKTLLTRYFAFQLKKLESMVTLHLNEQSDAKLLVGMYTTGVKPGTFSWRPGVLTTAVKEGRWIFIEDLDRAPNEVIGTLLPLIERNELLIPSRGETVRAARGFRIIATIRTAFNSRGQEIIPRQNMIGQRFWTSITVCMPDLEEFQQIATRKYPVIQKHVSAIIRVYARILILYSDTKFSSENGTSLRALTPRDLLKWCDRVNVLLRQNSSFNSAQMDNVFMEAFDCFAGSLRSEKARAMMMACVAEELHIDPQRRDHLLQSREVRFEMPAKSTSLGSIQIGRVKLERHKATKRNAAARPFSANGYTLRLLEKIAAAVARQEPLLLVGETGTGKTTSIQYLAEQLGRNLIAFNMSQQSESGDLLGGYKPVNVRSLVIPLKDEFDVLFDTTFSRKKNLRFVEMLGKRVAKGEWNRVCKLWREALKMVDTARKAHESQTSSPDPDGGQPKKKRKVDSLPATFLGSRWDKFAADLHDLEAQLENGAETFAFSFQEGNIVKAVRNGDWVLLDEINLASSDTLEALTDLLGGGPDGAPSILLTESGNVERVVAHPNFRVFAAMNPATDVGKKDLPPGIRSRFTELYVESPDSDRKCLQSVVEKYLGGDTVDASTIRIASDVTSLYLKIQEFARANMLVDGAEQKAHFSLRTLTRTLSYAREIAPLCSLRRALFEGFHMSFLTFLNKASEDLIAPLIIEYLFPQKAFMKAELGKPLSQPTDGRDYLRHGHYWLRQGPHPTEEQPHYIITAFVQRNMNNLLRAASTRRYPVLIQGPTSSGKTSMIEYLAKRSGNKFVRINNHEHTDLQEYLGSYISGPDGKLIFQEGILVRALREGHWIVLDELNLAPTDVLEALNRLLDDNRELLIPETQEVVRPHEDFMLFATQNPAGLYGGRKALSRAFRNRFLELHFDDIPVEELTEILHRRTLIPESWCKKIVSVYRELSALRQENRIFEQKSFATLRDLFRWAQRKADTIQDLANNGYMLLAERVRKEEERVAVKSVIEQVMSKKGPRVTINEELMFSEDASDEMKLYKEKTSTNTSVVWTKAMRRLFVLVAHAIRNNEPVLLVGETGCGKTTVCQMLADAFEKQLHILNAHQNTETGDLIGAQRPIRNRVAVEDLLRRQLLDIVDMHYQGLDVSLLSLSQLLEIYDKLGNDVRSSIPLAHQKEIQANRIRAGTLFEWADGSLVNAMKTGQYFLLDEISLADDSVLERLNSVLESSRTLLMAEKGPEGSLVTAGDGFQFLATMNPGGDYGKKELSPALRNRFTEIWVPALSDTDDILQIVRSKLRLNAVRYAESLVSFSQWFNEKYDTSAASSISIRDTLAWVTFINSVPVNDTVFGIVHGAAMVFIDTLGANPAGLLAIAANSIDDERRSCLHHLSELLCIDISPIYYSTIEVISTDTTLQLGPFSIPKYTHTYGADVSFSFEAPTTRSNATRVVRALQLSKPILLEGNPGVGKTTLVTALARAIGKPLTRLNLSEQTDLMDLFGSDVPVEGGQAGTFTWRDAPFLKAMKNGDWVLLDEMNLASQSVLEGLNAVLDHRGEVYISELDQTFHKHSEFRVFAAQNPHHQGGGRKGLPASFVNRFTVVYADVFRPQDLLLICLKIFPGLEEIEVEKLIKFVAELNEQVVHHRTFGNLGAPWEFNLRDTMRWLQLLTTPNFPGSARDFLDAIFVQRFRSEADRCRLVQLFDSTYGVREPRMTLHHDLSSTTLQVGLGLVSRDSEVATPTNSSIFGVHQLPPMEALMVSVRQNWPVILVGPSGAGKTWMVNQLASFTGKKMLTFSMNADIDAMDLVGGYEQIDPSRDLHRLIGKLEDFLRRSILAGKEPPQATVSLLALLSKDAYVPVQQILPLLHLITVENQGYLEAIQLEQDFQALLEASQHIDGARFQWVDGILVQALEQGQWLVLDNANLCSSAVLDRLNSLLEPNGYLSINEHSTADGEARIVTPHPEFRIFMTMDPRFGELSRAMRNRAVEICLLPNNETTNIAGVVADTPIAYALDSSVYRFRHLCTIDLRASVQSKLETFSTTDGELLPSFRKQLVQGLSSIRSFPMLDNTIASTLATTNGTSVGGRGGANDLDHFLDFMINTWDSLAKGLQSKLDELDQVNAATAPTQSYHPLVNELLLHRNSHQSLLVQYAAFYEVLLDLYNMQNALKTIPPTRFERRKEVQKLPAFLGAIRQALANWTEHALRMDQSVSKGLMPNKNTKYRHLRQLFWAFYQLLAGPNFDRATFQTYLKMLTSLASSLAKTESSAALQLASTISREIGAFGSDVQLTSGLGMERVWLRFKPITPKTSAQLASVLCLENLADRLDTVMWKSNLRIEEMMQVRERLTSSLELVRSQTIDATELIVALEIAVRELEESIDEDDVAVNPYFVDVFEGLCQYLDITQNRSPKPERPHASPDSVPDIRAKSYLLSRRPTRLPVAGAITDPWGMLDRLSRYLGWHAQSGQEIALRGSFHAVVLSKLQSADEVQLAQLSRFEAELQVLSQQLVLDSEHITSDQHGALDNLYRWIVDHLSASHRADIIFQINEDSLVLREGVSISNAYLDQLGHLKKCFGHANAPRHVDHQAWISLGLAGLALYVPNYPHDPALRPMIERKLFNEEKMKLMKQSQSLREFQMVFTGQDTSYRIRQAEDTMREMGEEPVLHAIARPAVSELDALQGEFTNLLSVIHPLATGRISVQEATTDKTLKQNIVHIIRRLNEGYRSYDDITGPAVGFLACLGIGLTLGAKEQKQSEDIAQSLKHLMEHTPFLGYHRLGNPKSASLVLSCDNMFYQNHRGVELRWHALYYLAVTKSLDPGHISTKETRCLLQNIFSSFYLEWKEQLLHNQREEAKNSSLYTYRGDGDLDEDDLSIFPSYEEDENKSIAPISTSRENAIRLANIHNKIFLGGSNANEDLKELLQWCISEMNRVAKGDAHGTSHELVLPAIYLALEKKADTLVSPSISKAYNFYFDANLPEAKRMIGLVHRIQYRYRRIRKVWPEHATLWDVLRTCDEALEFRHVDPVAKLITKTEQLHGYIYEWQRVASREFSTADLFDDLTKLLISWRQLELTTWARLFDIETEKCRDDAKSWFFVAYETIIAAGESVENGEHMKVHIHDLLQTLEGFFTSTTLGQYGERTKLLRQFHRHAVTHSADNALLIPLCTALENFISYFERLQKPVDEAIVKGRQALEREVTNVIKLASWKDTNIEALKQSAKTSHRKLSKLVRKFRGMLNQPVSGIIKAGFPEDNLDQGQQTMEVVSMVVPSTALGLCAEKIKDWEKRPTRFKNLTITISMMRTLSTPRTNAVQSVTYIENFISDLESSVLQLQKATPNTLTEDNKEEVQHLKTRKRKLYADTMKELRQMGVKSNLSSDVLARQNSLHQVLANLPTIGSELGKKAEYFLHKSLHIMPQVRDVAKEHHGDLTSNDVLRSIGYIEGLLHASIQQRSILSKATQALHQLQSPMSILSSFSNLYDRTIKRVSEAQIDAAIIVQPNLSWLSAILDTGADIIAAQAKLGKTSEVDELDQEMRKWSTQFRGLSNASDQLPVLPPYVWSEAHIELEKLIQDRLASFQVAFADWMDRFPISRTILVHIEHFMFPYQNTQEDVHGPREKLHTIEQLSKTIFSSLDLILGSVQDVESALQNSPTSTDEIAWMVKEEQTLSAAINAFHARQIIAIFGSVLEQVQNHHEASSLQVIAAILTTVHPFMSQYVISYKALVERFYALHCSTVKLLHRLSKSFVQVGMQGFCQPQEKSADQQQGKDEKLESGTGLGEGEGAEDISKDIQEDEDLEELAREKNGERESSIEDQEDAVDMGDQEMEGETGEMAEKEDEGSDAGDGEEDAQSEVDSVDDLGPSAVDEKMWDEGGKDDDAKDKEGKQDVGTENQDDQIAADQKEKSGEDGGNEDEKKDEAGQEDEDIEMEGEDQEETVGMAEAEQLDPHAKEEETLDLPDELNMEGNEDDINDDDLDDTDMGDDLPEEDMDNEAMAEPDTISEEIGDDTNEKDASGHVEDEEMDHDQDQADQEPQEDAVPLPDQNLLEEDSYESKDNQADPNAEAGTGADANDEASKNQQEKTSAGAASHDEGAEGELSEKQQEATAENGTLGQTALPDAGGHGEQHDESPETQSFKKLGDVLERWYNQQKQISNARERDETQVQQIDKEIDMANADFEHLPGEDAQADTQALGTATEEQAKGLDEDMAMAVDEDEQTAARPEDHENDHQDDHQDVDMQDPLLSQREEQQQQSAADNRPQAFVGEQKPFSEDADIENAMALDDDISETSSVSEVGTKLELTHLDVATGITPESARALWLSHESSTHSLSQQLTESLRLILAPTLATKLRGDFRTGKRLNLKRIIPYIASSYKRDKIWLRRSMPSKRSYQVMIALDDSKSMAESGVSSLALKTLTLITRSMAMLEVGEVSVVGFGDEVNVAHDFDKPFTSESGVKVFEQFGFNASKTNVRGLVHRSLELFAEARRKGSSSVGEDLWQLMLIVSDGICDSHAEIQRLIRRAQEERVMVVFVIIDSSSPLPQPESASEAVGPRGSEKEKEKTSIMDLQSVEISAEGKVIRWKYMERFPFRYYLVVRDVRELPGVLAGALRQWFGEVVGSA